MNVSHQPDSSELIIRLDSDLLSTNAESLAEDLDAALFAHVDAEWSSLVLDLYTARMVDSVGLNLLLALLRRLRERQRSLTVIISSEAIRRAFTTAHLDQHVAVVFKKRRQR